MSKMARSVEVTNAEDYLTLGDLRALVDLCEGISDDAYLSSFDGSAGGKIDHLKVEEPPFPVGGDPA